MADGSTQLEMNQCGAVSSLEQRLKDKKKKNEYGIYQQTSKIAPHEMLFLGIVVGPLNRVCLWRLEKSKARYRRFPVSPRLSLIPLPLNKNV